MKPKPELPASGSTDVSRPLAHVFTAAWLLTFVAFSAAAWLPPLGGRDLPGEPLGIFFAAASELTAAEGPIDANRRLESMMDELENGLENTSALRAATLPTLQWLLTGWCGVGNEQVYVGYRGWLFYRPGVDYMTGPPLLDRPEADPRPALLDFHQQLQRRGIELLILPVPSKAMVRPERLAPLYDGRDDDAPPSHKTRSHPARLHNPSFSELQSTLESAGTRVFDPGETLSRYEEQSGENAYLRTDSHWTPGGIDAVAHELATRIRGLDLPFEGPTQSWRRYSGEHRARGDLVRMLFEPPGTLELFPWWKKLYPKESVRLERLRGWAVDQQAEILLLGDSFTNVFSVSDASLPWGTGAGLAEQLSFHLERGVDQIAINNESATGVRQRLALAGASRLAGKKLVVYQIAVREFAVGDWRRVELP